MASWLNTKTRGGAPPTYLVQMRPKMLLNLIGVRWEPPYTYYLVQYLARRIKWDLPFPGQGSQCRARGGRQSCIVSSWLNIILAGWLASHGWLAGWLYVSISNPLHTAPNQSTFSPLQQASSFWFWHVWLISDVFLCGSNSTQLLSVWGHY